jgi:hypothetical protein
MSRPKNDYLTMRPVKNCFEVNSRLDTKIEPYQNTSEIMKKENAWESAYNRLLQMAVRFESRRGFSRLLL